MDFNKNFHCEKQTARDNKWDHFIQSIAREHVINEEYLKEGKGALGLTEASKQESGSYESHEDEWRWVFSESLRKDEGES